MSVITRREKTVNNRGRGITTVTMEMVGATDENDISAPTGQTIKNVRRAIADGRAVLTYDEVPDGVGDTYSISGTASQEPLATHPFFQPGGKWAVTDDEWKTWDKWQKEGTDIGSESLTSFSEGFQKFIQLTLSGFTDYLQPRVTIRVTDTNSKEPDLSELGKIANPNPAPTLADGANWLLTSVDATEDADQNWDITKEYMSSGPGGWNEDIYGAGGTGSRFRL
jgi:hypothetical protein